MDTITSPLVNSLNVYDHLIIRHFQLEWAGSVDQLAKHILLGVL